MKPQVILNKKTILTLSIITLLCASICYIITVFYFFPNQIKILADSENRLDFRVPIHATIQSETVFNVNNQSVDSNISVNLANGFYINVPKVTSLNMNLNFFGIPIRTVTLESIEALELIPWGNTVGVRIETEGVMVLGTGYVSTKEGDIIKPAENILRSGDLILEANGVKLNRKEDLIRAIESSTDKVEMIIRREGEKMDVYVKVAVCATDNKNRLGVWVRDSTQGIGTITYYNPNTGEFAALGHGILDVDTKKLMSVESGTVMEANISSAKRGKKGSPGELQGDIDVRNVIGSVTLNTPYGIFGTLNESANLPQERMRIALQSEVREGPAVIRANVTGNEIKEYDIYIESLNRHSNNDSKGMVIRIVDEELIKVTNGIVQGMSGSPIIQNGKLIGAVTHVFVQEPTRGYGIFIENMLKQTRATE